MFVCVLLRHPATHIFGNDAMFVSFLCMAHTQYVTWVKLIGNVIGIQVLPVLVL